MNIVLLYCLTFLKNKIFINLVHINDFRTILLESVAIFKTLRFEEFIRKYDKNKLLGRVLTLKEV